MAAAEQGWLSDRAAPADALPVRDVAGSGRPRPERERGRDGVSGPALQRRCPPGSSGYISASSGSCFAAVRATHCARYGSGGGFDCRTRVWLRSNSQAVAYTSEREVLSVRPRSHVPGGSTDSSSSRWCCAGSISPHQTARITLQLPTKTAAAVARSPRVVGRSPRESASRAV